MKNKKTFISITVVAAVVSFLLTRVIWPDPVGAVMPQGGLLVGFIFVNSMEALGVGVGLAFLYTAWGSMKSHPWVLAATTFLLVSWWPHDSLHRVGENNGLAYLLGLELAFHVSLIVCGFILANYILKQSRDN